MRIKFIKIEEGEVKRRNKAAKKAWEEKQGKRTEGHRGTFVTAAQKQVAKGADKSTQAGVKAGYRGVARAAEYDKPGPHKGNLAGDYAKEFGSPNAAMRHGRKGGKLRHDSSTEILGDKIVEGIFDLFGARARKARNFRSGEGARDPQAFSRAVRRTYDKANEPAEYDAQIAKQNLDRKGEGDSIVHVHPSVEKSAISPGFPASSERDPVATHARGDDKDRSYGGTGPFWNQGGRKASKAAYQKDYDTAKAKAEAGRELTRTQGIEAANTRQRRLALRSKLLAKSGSGGGVARKVRTGLSRIPGIGSMFRPKRRGLTPQMGGFKQRTSGFTEQERFGYAICESFNNLLNEYRGKHSGYKKGEAPARGSEEAKTVAKRTRFERGAAEAGSKDPNLAKSRLRMVATGKYPDGAPASLEDKKQMGRIVARTGKVAKRAGGKPVSREGAGVRSREENNQRNKKEESLDYTHNDRFDEISHKLKQRAAKAAEKKAKEHAKIADAAKKVGARDTEVIHDKISRSKTTQADKFKGNTGGEDKRGKQQYHQAKKEAGIGTRRVPVSKR